MTDLSPKAQDIVDAYENTTDKYKALAAALRALVNTSSVSYFFANGEEHIVNSRLILNLAKELENI